jgi:hypothetical protein
MNTTSKVFIGATLGAAALTGGLSRLVLSSAAAAGSYYGAKKIVGLKYDEAVEAVECKLAELEGQDGAQIKDIEAKLLRSKKVFESEQKKTEAIAALTAIAMFANMGFGILLLGGLAVGKAVAHKKENERLQNSRVFMLNGKKVKIVN